MNNILSVAANRGHLTAMVLTIACGSVFQSAVAQNDKTIVEHIVSAGDNSISQPESISRLLIRIDPEELKSQLETETSGAQRQRSSGWRIQVFSDSNQRTAKGEARAKSRNISSRFPQYRTYVTYNSPYWRLRVGDFQSQAEANEAAEELKRAFPSYAKEIRVVRDRIN